MADKRHDKRRRRQVPFESPVVRTYDAWAPDNDQDALTLSDLSHLAKTSVRAGHDTAAAAHLDVPFGTTRTVDGLLICGQRPDEWTLIGDVEARDEFLDGLDTEGHVSVVDITHGRALFRLTGRAATTTLEKICSLDWSDAMTPDGATMSASVAKVTCDLVRSDASHDRRGGSPGANESAKPEERAKPNERARPKAKARTLLPSYLVSCDRSFGQYLFDAILDAGDEFDISVD